MSLKNIKNYQWRQTKDKILIYIYLNHSEQYVNFCFSPNYVKAVCKPAYASIEFFLWKEIKTKESFCILEDKEIIFSLKKNEINLEWPNLENICLNKKLYSQLKKQNCDNIQHILQLDTKEKIEKYEDRKKQAIKAQIYLDESVNKKINIIQLMLKQQAIKSLEDSYWKLNLNDSKSHYEEFKICNPILRDSYSNRFLMKDTITKTYDTKEKKSNSKISLNKQICDNADISESLLTSEFIKNENKFNRTGFIKRNIFKSENSLKNIFDEIEINCPPRKSSVIHILFTERILQTPARESYHTVEMQYSQNQQTLKTE